MGVRWRYVLLLFLAFALLRRRRRPARQVSLPRPVLAFSGCGLLMTYYYGVCLYLREHFEVDAAVVSGISGGCSSLLFLCTGMHMKDCLLATGERAGRGTQERGSPGCFACPLRPLLPLSLPRGVGVGVGAWRCCRSGCA